MTKAEFIQRLEPINDRLKKINKELEVDEEDILFEIDEDIEIPETEIEVTEEDIV